MTKIVEAKVRQASTTPEPILRQPEAVRGDREGRCCSFTDWEFDGNVDNAIEAAKGFWPSLKEHGAANLRVTVTSDKTLRTMTIWSDE